MAPTENASDDTLTQTRPNYFPKIQSHVFEKSKSTLGVSSLSQTQTASMSLLWAFEPEKAPDQFLQWTETEAAVEVEAVGIGAFLITKASLIEFIFVRRAFCSTWNIGSVVCFLKNFLLILKWQKIIPQPVLLVLQTYVRLPEMIQFLRNGILGIAWAYSHIYVSPLTIRSTTFLTAGLVRGGGSAVKQPPDRHWERRWGRAGRAARWWRRPPPRRHVCLLDTPLPLL